MPPFLCSVARLPLEKRPVSFAPPPRDGFAFLAEALPKRCACATLINDSELQTCQETGQQEA
jgi:hypothetical protein